MGDKQLKAEANRGRSFALSDGEIQPWVLTQQERNIFDRRFCEFPFPSNFASLSKRIFDKNTGSRLKGNDLHYLLSDVGMYCMTDSNLRFDQRRVIAKLCHLRKHLCRGRISYQQLQELEGELKETLAEFEAFFPFYAMTINTHMLLHLPEQIRRTGPVCHSWMYGTERHMGRLVDSVRSFKVVEESMARSAVMTELFEQVRLGDPEHYDPVFSRRNALQGADLNFVPLYAHSEQICIVRGRSETAALSLLEQRELVSYWRRLHGEFDDLLKRFEHEVESGGTESKEITQWAPAERPLTPTQAAMRYAPCKEGKMFLRAFRNAISLRSRRIDAKFSRTDCYFRAEHITMGLCYGQAEGFLQHQLYYRPDAPVTVFVKVHAWFRPLPPCDTSGLSRCKRVSEADDDASLWGSFCPAGDIAPVAISMMIESRENSSYFVFEFGRA